MTYSMEAQPQHRACHLIEISTLREDGKTDSFTYYLDGELWTATYGNPSPTRTVTYNIDQMGNRTSVVDTGVTTNYTPDSGGLNQYSQVATNTVGNGSEHEIALYQNIAYTYVNDERLSSITSAGSPRQSHSQAAGRIAAWGLMGNQRMPIMQGGALGGGTAWGRQANGTFVDSAFSNVSLAGGIVGAQGGAIHPVPRWLY